MAQEGEKPPWDPEARTGPLDNIGKCPIENLHSPRGRKKGREKRERQGGELHGGGCALRGENGKHSI